MRHALAALVVTGSATLVPALCAAELKGAGDVEVSFIATGPAGLRIEGKTKELRVSEEAGKVKVVVPLGNLDTGIALRNKHMREKYLEVPKFPVAELVVERRALTFPTDAQPEVKGSLRADLTIHGKTKSVSVPYTARRSGANYTVRGTPRIDMREFGIEVPSYLGITVKPEVELDVRFGCVDGPASVVPLPSP